MALGDLHIFTGEEYVDTELAPLLNENFNSLKEYVDDASRWQVMPVQFKGTNAKFLIHETTLGTGTTQVLPLVVLDNTDIAKFSACSLKVVMSTKNGSTAAVNCDISLQKVHNSNECNVNFNTTNSDDAKAEPCTFTYNNIKYAGLKLTTGNADTLWVSGYTTDEWIAPVVDTSVTNLVTLGSDMNVIPTLFKSLQTDKSPVNDYDVVNKKSLNDLTNIKTYSQLSQIGLSGGVLDNSPYAIGNALPANSMLIIGVSGSTNNHDYPVMTGNLTVVRAHSNHVMFQIDAELNNNDVQRYILQYKIDSVDSSAAKNWKRILTDVDTGYWQPNETVTKDTVRKLIGKQYAGCFLVCKVAGTTGSTQPSPDPADGAGIGGGSITLLDVYPVGSIYMSTNSTNPGTLFGGTWEAYAQGCVLIGAGTGTDSRGEKKTFAAGDTGGEYNHQLTVGEMPAHGHDAIISTSGKHSHGIQTGNNTDAPYNMVSTQARINNTTRYTKEAGNHTHTATISNAGSSAVHNNLPPYLSVFIWQRIN